MKKNYSKWMMAFALVFVVAQGAWAQATWKSHTAEASAVKAETRADYEGTIWLGQCKYDDYIYQMDGLSLDYDARVGVGIKLTRDMFEDYIGGTIEAIRAGWDDNSIAKYECFIREENFNNPDLATGSASVKFGWNEIKLKEPLVIPDVQTLCVGFYTNIKKGVCSIPKLYPYGKPNTCFLFNEEYTEDNQEIWYDSRDMGTMPIMIKIVDKTGQFSNMIEVTDLFNDIIVHSDTESAGFFTIKNTGSNAISSVEIKTTHGEQSTSRTISLGSPINTASSSKVKLPIHCFGSGETTVQFTKVNGVTPKKVAEKKVNLLGIPESVSEKYIHRPVLEIFTSENSYAHPTYFDEYLMPEYEPFKEYMTLICQHSGDKYMIGDPDEAILLQLGLANFDSMKVYLPDMCLNRTAYVSAPINLPGTPFHYGILYPTPLVAPYYTDVISRPTFAGVSVEAALNEAKDKVQIKVTGDVSANILPEGEHLYLTVYLMENQVESSDQQFWDEKEGIQLGNKYVHYNVIRENLTGLWGNKLSVANGEFSVDFATDVYSDYNLENLSVIAILNRGEENAHNQRNIINSCEARVETGATAIENVTVGEKAESNKYYDLSGRRVAKPAKGIYVNNGKKVYVK